MPAGLVTALLLLDFHPCCARARLAPARKRRARWRLPSLHGPPRRAVEVSHRSAEVRRGGRARAPGARRPGGETYRYQ
eukprot:scaffold116711_cov30-Phaeocystis_antarctica.AAC.1